MKTTLVATMQCVGCQHQWTLRDPDAVPSGEHPMCPHCMSPGMLLKAERKVVREASPTEPQCSGPHADARDCPVHGSEVRSATTFRRESK